MGGDWGVASAYPLYEESRDKPYVYQNGADWPYLDGINAAARLKLGLENWEYPLTRWWTHQKDLGLDPAIAEYVSFDGPGGSSTQGWSTFPAAVILKYGL
jgi:hypothetical protein